jgi:hypothetical protein
MRSVAQLFSSGISAQARTLAQGYLMHSIDGDSFRRFGPNLKHFNKTPSVWGLDDKKKLTVQR